MLISVLIVGGMMAAAMAVSAVFLNEIRLARQTPESVKAIYAADTGVECSLYKYFLLGDPLPVTCTGGPVGSGAEIRFETDATFRAQIVVVGAATSSTSIGKSRGVGRALEVLILF